MTIAAQVAQSIEHAKLYAQAQRRVHELEALARISEAVSESLYLEESLEAIVKTTVESPRDRRGDRARGRSHRVARGPGRGARDQAAVALARPQIGELVVDRDTPFSDDDRQLLGSIASQAAVALEHGRGAPRRARPGDPSPCQEQPADGRLAAPPPGPRRRNVDPQKALSDSVNRILAIAAVHEVLTEHRDEDVELDELIDRLRAMLVQGLVAGRR